MTKDPRGRKKGSLNKTTLEIREMIARVCGDPLIGMATIAKGDVVALGFMTKEDFDSKGKLIWKVDARGNRYQEYLPSGRERALSYIPPELRSKMFKELAEYGYAKRRAVQIEDADGNPRDLGGVTFYIPDNGREEIGVGQKIVVKKAPKK